MKTKVESLMKTAGILLMCIAMMGACKCKVCKDGEDGEPGNAEVKMFTYGSKTSVVNIISQIVESNTLTYAIPLSAEVIGKSAVHAYFQTPNDAKLGNNNWNVLTGTYWEIIAMSKISGSDYIISFLESSNGSLYPYPYTISIGAFKIIVVPVPDENVKEVKSAVSLNWDNYSEVAAYYGLPE